MKNILIGLVLVFLDIDLNFGVGKMDLLPDPIGFLFVLGRGGDRRFREG